jgi:hypothetical protein
MIQHPALAEALRPEPRPRPATKERHESPGAQRLMALVLMCSLVRRIKFKL